MMGGKWWRVVVAVALALLVSVPVAAQEEEVDWGRARELLRRSQQGGTLSPEEQAYLQRAREERARRLRDATPGRPTVGLTPLTELGKDGYKGEDGGLYGRGRNEPPPEHLQAALAQSALVVPRDADGKPSPQGKIVLVSIGMSNTSQEFTVFKGVADGDPEKSPHLVIVNGAQGGQDASRWAVPEGQLSPGQPDAWAVLHRRLTQAGVTPAQVQVAWVKQAQARPDRFGDFPDHARRMEADLVVALQRLKSRFPNLRLVYLSSRIYAGFARTLLNPEPYAYEGAFSVRWLIQDQIAGKPDLNYDARRGPAKAPLLLWGPHLWGDGTTPRQADGLTWEERDFADDGTHPSPSGQQKVASSLLEFLKSHSTSRPWFLK